MQSYDTLSIKELSAVKNDLQMQYNAYKSMGLNLNMSRGKPDASQLDITTDMLKTVTSAEDCFTQDGTDCRNYGLLDGIPEAKQLLASILDVSADEILVGGNSSLNLIYDIVARAMTHGVLGSSKPWGRYDKIKFLCPVPGYDRHFTICEHFGIEMINIEMKDDGPDMDKVESLVSSDETIKGIWCIPLYSNPQGISYSDEVVRRFARLKPKAKDFRIMWDNAYAVHHLTDTPNIILNILEECKKAGNADMVFEFTSTSKISFPGGGISALAASKENLEQIKKQIFVQTIGPDKLNQLRHVKFFKNLDGIKEHMKRHADILKPKFDTVLNILDNELGSLGVAQWSRPKGGYFISLNTLKGCAKRVVELACEAGVTMTPAGATYPYRNDPSDSNIRIAPTYPPVSELSTAMELFCICIKLASIEKIMESKQI